MYKLSLLFINDLFVDVYTYCEGEKVCCYGNAPYRG